MHFVKFSIESLETLKLFYFLNRFSCLYIILCLLDYGISRYYLWHYWRENWNFYFFQMMCLTVILYKFYFNQNKFSICLHWFHFRLNLMSSILFSNTFTFRLMYIVNFNFLKTNVKNGEICYYRKSLNLCRSVVN